MNLRTLGIDKSWTLFLDRDGVINRQIMDAYVRTWDEFGFLPGVPEAISKLNQVFGRTVIVTNQQGVGKGLMSMNDLEDIHRRMTEKIVQAGGRIDAIYVSAHLAASRHFDRKPSIGMALKARKQFRINLKKSVMAGDSLTDMVFGRNAGMTTVLIKTEPAISRKYPGLVDYWFESLGEFAGEVAG